MADNNITYDEEFFKRLYKAQREFDSQRNRDLEDYSRRLKDVNKELERTQDIISSELDKLDKLYEDRSKKLRVPEETYRNAVKQLDVLDEEIAKRDAINERVIKLSELQDTYLIGKRRTDPNASGMLATIKEEKEALDKELKDSEKAINKQKAYIAELSDADKKFEKSISDNITEEGKRKKNREKYLEILGRINSAKEKGLILSKEQTKETQRAYEIQRKSEDSLREINRAVKSVWSGVKKVANTWMDFNDMAFKGGRAIGLNRQELENYQQSLIKNTINLAARYGVTTKELAQYQETYWNNIGRNIRFTEAQTENVTAMSKLVGDTNVQTTIDNMDRMGSSVGTAVDYMALVSARAQAYGLNATKSAELFAKNIGLAQKYNFREGINGVSKMVTLSQRLRFNMESIASVADTFSTIEGAIGASAKLQVLGGSYAMNFGNPMAVMYEALNDMEGLTERIVNTVAGKGYFDRTTGEVQMSSIDKRFIKEAAQALGMNADDLRNAAYRQITTREVESQINRSERFTDVEKTAISNLATYDRERGWIVKYMEENGEERSELVKNLKRTDIDKVNKGTKSFQDSVKADVRQIAQYMREARERAQSTVSMRDQMKGIVDVFKSAGAMAFNPIGNFLGGGLNDMSGGYSNVMGNPFAQWGSLLTTVAGPTLGYFLGKRATRAGRGAIGRIYDRGGTTPPVVGKPVKNDLRIKENGTRQYYNGRKWVTVGERNYNRRLAAQQATYTKGGKFSGAATRGAGIASVAGIGLGLANNAAISSGVYKQDSGLATVGDVGSNALTWGGTGAMLGSAIAPGIGTIIGGAIGAIGGGIYGWLQNKERRDAYKNTKIQPVIDESQTIAQNQGILPVSIYEVSEGALNKFNRIKGVNEEQTFYEVNGGALNKFNWVKGGNEEQTFINPATYNGFTYVSPTYAAGATYGTDNSPISVEPIAINITGRIVLEGGNNSTNLDLSKLLNNEGAKNQITDMIVTQINKKLNAGRVNNNVIQRNKQTVYKDI
jgi:hypothetical protein